MIAQALLTLVLVLGTAFGIGRPLAGRLRLPPAETLLAGTGLSLVASWLIAWAVFTMGLPLAGYWALPALAVMGVAATGRSSARLLADPLARDLVVGQLLVSGACVVGLSFIASYSGGAWLGDWFEHWQRAHYFLRLWPEGALFIDQYELPARPPLANVLCAAFLEVGGRSFAHFQVVMTVLASLAFLPVGLLAARFGGPRSVRLACIAVLASPLFFENATYPWTKLQAAFFILGALYFFLGFREGGREAGTCAVLSAVFLGGAVVTHYSAGPYAVMIAAAWIGQGFARKGGSPFLRATAAAALFGGVILAAWFGWSMARLGWRTTFLSNTTVSMERIYPGNPLLVRLLNLRDTLLPPELRGFHGRLFVQTSPWGRLRDAFFVFYQVNLLGALGGVGWAAIAWRSWRTAAAAPAAERRFWLLFLAGVLVLSFAVYGDREHYGIAHACLQPAILLGVAFLAAQWDSLGKGWKIAVAAGWATDFCLGIVLQAAVEGFAFDRWTNPGTPAEVAVQGLNIIAQENLRQKRVAHLATFADSVPTSPVFLVALVAGILCMALVRARRAPSSP